MRKDITERIVAMSDEELVKALPVVEQSLADIRAQLDNARTRKVTTGEYADAQWYSRARAALRYKGIEHQAIVREKALRAKQLRVARAEDVNQKFVSSARRLLTPEEFKLIMEEAKQ